MPSKNERLRQHIEREVRFLEHADPTPEQRAEAESLAVKILEREDRVAALRASIEAEHDERDELRARLQALLMGWDRGPS